MSRSRFPRRPHAPSVQRLRGPENRAAKGGREEGVEPEADAPRPLLQPDPRAWGAPQVERWRPGRSLWHSGCSHTLPAPPLPSALASLPTSVAASWLHLDLLRPGALLGDQRPLPGSHLRYKVLAKHKCIFRIKVLTFLGHPKASFVRHFKRGLGAMPGSPRAVLSAAERMKRPRAPWPADPHALSPTATSWASDGLRELQVA